MKNENEFEYTVGNEEENEQENFVSILDESGVLTRNNFEEAIACGCSKEDLLVQFGKTFSEMNSWCMRNYNGLHFDEAYNRMLRIIRNKFLEKCNILSDRGNASALNILAQFLLKYAENSETTGITIINNVPGGVVVDEKDK